jgi:hypothetical protein
MNASSLCRAALSVCILAAAAGCGGQTGSNGATAAIPSSARFGPSVRSWILPEAKHAKELLYVGDPTPDPSYTGVIDIFSLHGLKYKLVGQIADDDGPDGMTTDAAGNLYVTDEGVATSSPVHGDIKIYPLGSTSYSRLIIPIKWVPFDVAVRADGTMYVANIAPFEAFSPGSVSIFPPDASQPSRTLNLANFQVYGITLHRLSQTIYISYAPSGDNGAIAEFKRAHGKAKNFGVSYPSPWGILEDGSDNLLACSASGSIDVYSEATHKLVQQIAVPGSPDWEAFDQNRSRLFVSNFDQVEILSYPAGKVIGTINAGWNTNNYPTGVAYWPPPT